eukprot:1195326-Prorocentrum_minimum.AAC.12
MSPDAAAANSLSAVRSKMKVPPLPDARPIRVVSSKYVSWPAHHSHHHQRVGRHNKVVSVQGNKTTSEERCVNSTTRLRNHPTLSSFTSWNNSSVIFVL